MDRTEQQWAFREGDDVFASDGGKVGKVAAVRPGHLVVEKGFFFPTDYYIPTGAVADYEAGRVYLNVPKDAALAQGWDQPPTEGTTDATTGTATTDTTRGAADRRFDDALRVPVHEEELTATKRQREIGRVGVTKDVVAEERVLEVPVTEERVRVQRTAVDREAAPDATAFEGGTIEVPIRGEEVQLQKRTRVAEEVEVGKERVRRTETVGGTVRREEVRIDESGDVAADPGETRQRRNA